MKSKQSKIVSQVKENILNKYNKKKIIMLC